MDKALNFNFGNWIRQRIIKRFLWASLVFLMFFVLVQQPLIKWAIAIVCWFFFSIALLLIYIRRAFSSQGSDIQQQLWELTLSRFSCSGAGKVLDIGTGNGSIAIMIASKYPEAQVTGLDLWGKDWEYSKSDCEKNAQAARVDKRTVFVEGSAASLPYPDNYFDAVVSHFVFHEVNKKNAFLVLLEALRILKPGGAFCFHDMFFDTKPYGKTNQFENNLKGLGLKCVEIFDSRKAMEVPFILRMPRVLGNCAIISGVK